MNPIHVDALFLGPKSENQGFLRKMVGILIDEHIHWRRNFHPDDPAAVTHQLQRTEPFLATWDRTEEALYDLSNRLRSTSMPWFSPRYLGHMNSDVLMPAVLGYLATVLYNPNNCAYDGSPATTEMELEVGAQLGSLMGYDPERSWGHITSGGTVANFEALWCARNLKSIPQAVREVAPDLVAGMDDWRLLNLPTGAALDLLEEAKRRGCLQQVLDRSVRGVGLAHRDLGKLLVPRSKHYSWLKAQDIFGLGRENMILLPVRNDFRLDVDETKRVVERLASRKTPILGVVGVVGTTEEGAVDAVHELVRYRDECQERGLGFYLHLDAAYGGYARSIFLDEHDRFMGYEETNERRRRECTLGSEAWPVQRDVYEAYKAMPAADSITVDCHKLGYIPYSAGAIVHRDRRVLDLLSTTAAYVEGRQDPALLGPFILEGSKPGAAAAAVWAAHRVVPRNAAGYGRIIGRSMDAAGAFFRSIAASEPFRAANGKTYRVRPLTTPDLNMVTFAFNALGNESLEVMNAANERVYERCSHASGPVYRSDFITSKTILTPEDYGDAVLRFLEELRIPESEWRRVGKLYVLRSTVMSPFIATRMSYETYWAGFMRTMERVIDLPDSGPPA